MNSAISSFLSGAWSVLTGFHYPGVGVSLASILFGSCIAVISLNLLGNIFGFSFGGSIGRLSRAVHGGNNKNIKISDNRRGDQK